LQAAVHFDIFVVLMGFKVCPYIAPLKVQVQNSPNSASCRWIAGEQQEWDCPTAGDEPGHPSASSTRTDRAQGWQQGPVKAPDMASEEPDPEPIQGTQAGAKETKSKELETGTPTAQHKPGMSHRLSLNRAPGPRAGCGF